MRSLGSQLIELKIIQKVMDFAGVYAYWMLGAFLVSIALFLAPSNLVVPILNNYSASDTIPALSILQAYHRAVSLTQIMYAVVIVIAVMVQIFFLVKTAKSGTRYLVGAIPLVIAIFGMLGGILIFSNVLDHRQFINQVSADIRQIEEGNLETATIHISPRLQLSTGNLMGSPLDIFLVNYNSPLQIIRGIRPGERLGWEDFKVPLALQFERNTNRSFDETRNIAHNLEHAQLYRVRFTSVQRVVYSIEPVASLP